VLISNEFLLDASGGLHVALISPFVFDDDDVRIVLDTHA